MVSEGQAKIRREERARGITRGTPASLRPAQDFLIIPISVRDYRGLRNILNKEDKQRIPQTRHVVTCTEDASFFLPVAFCYTLDPKQFIIQF
jgi:hypothetical protein